MTVCFRVGFYNNFSFHVKMDDPERPDKLLHCVTFASTSALVPANVNMPHPTPPPSPTQHQLHDVSASER